jgi:hypothetical protein
MTRGIKLDIQILVARHLEVQIKETSKYITWKFLWMFELFHEQIFDHFVARCSFQDPKGCYINQAIGKLVL